MDDGGVVQWLHGTSALQSHVSTPRFSMIDIRDSMVKIFLHLVHHFSNSPTRRRQLAAHWLTGKSPDKMVQDRLKPHYGVAFT